MTPATTARMPVTMAAQMSVVRRIGVLETGLGLMAALSKVSSGRSARREGEKGHDEAGGGADRTP